MPKLTQKMTDTVIMFVFLSLTSTAAFAEQHVIIGSSVIYCCKQFTLLTGDSRTMAGVNCDEKFFKKTREWFFDNIYASLNDGLYHRLTFLKLLLVLLERAPGSRAGFVLSRIRLQLEPDHHTLAEIT